MSDKKSLQPTVELPAKRLTWSQKLYRFVQDILVLAVTGGLIYLFDVVDVMLYSQRVFRYVLYVAVALHSLGFALIGWMSWITMRWDPEMESDHGKLLVQVTTGIFAVATVLWMVAVWPVFHFWTIPLSIAFLFFFVTAISLFSPEKKQKKME